MKRMNSCFFAPVIILLFSMFACTTPSKNPYAETDTTDTAPAKQITIAYVDWAEGVAMTHLAKAILDEQGYTTVLQKMDVAPVFASLANGDVDVFMDTWLPVTHASYMAHYGEQIESLGVNFDAAKIGLVVPAYLEISSIAQLNGAKAMLGARIIGIDADAGIMKTTQTAIEKYGLNYDLLQSSGPEMVAILQEKIENNEGVVVTGWAPHWKFARFDLKFLDDPKGIYGQTERIETTARKGFKEDYPYVAAFFHNFSMSSSQLGELMGAIAESDETPETVAKEWAANHPEQVKEWLPE